MLLFNRPEIHFKAHRRGTLGNINIYRKYDHYRKGDYLFSFLGNVRKRLIPFITKLFKTAALSFRASVVNNMKKGKTDLRSSLKKRGLEAAKRKVGSRIMRRGKTKRREKKM